MTKSTIHTQDPALPGQDPSIDEHRLNIHYLGTAYVTSRHVPHYMPRPLHLLIPWIDSFILSMNAHRADFVPVFNGNFPYAAHTLVQMRESLAAGDTSRKSLPGLQRGVTQWYNIVLFGRPDRTPLAPPRPETGMLPPAAAPAIGIVGMIQAMVELLIRQPNYNESVGRQFGILPGSTPPIDPATLDPQATGSFSGSTVLLQFRSPTRIRGIDVAEIRCDRNDGSGPHLVGTTSRPRFTDHPDPLPVGNARATYTYYVCYLDESNLPVGQQSVVDVTVHGRVQ